MHTNVVFGIVFTLMGLSFLWVGIFYKIPPHIIAGAFTTLLGAGFLFTGIPLELRERRYGARRRRWEELDEEERERVKKKREGAR
jgi:hypothetical protein